VARRRDLGEFDNYGRDYSEIDIHQEKPILEEEKNADEQGRNSPFSMKNLLQHLQI